MVNGRFQCSKHPGFQIVENGIRTGPEFRNHRTEIPIILPSAEASGKSRNVRKIEALSFFSDVDEKPSAHDCEKILRTVFDSPFPVGRNYRFVEIERPEKGKFVSGRSVEGFAKLVSDEFERPLGIPFDFEPIERS